ncbi:MAG: S-methyl-5-thioribose-1-phosphate isomerase [Phycisphaerales bacterium]
MNPIEAIAWVGDAETGHLRLLDQTRLPQQTSWLDCHRVDEVVDAIRRLSVRGAPAIGIAAAYGSVLGARAADPRDGFVRAREALAASRPTAVNLFWALERMMQATNRAHDDEFARAMLAEAKSIHDEDRRACRRIGELALELLRELTGDDLRLLTHCNAGALATGGIGTATAPMYLAREANLSIRVYADETRPLLQGARLTAWELGAAGIPVTLIADSAAASVLASGRVRAVITGADRIARNGDAANKIGTYPLAVLARRHRVPFVIAAPTSTIDLGTPSASEIPIEERASDELTNGFGATTAPAGVEAFTPAFDVTPADLIDAIVTERGVIRPVDETTMVRCVQA